MKADIYWIPQKCSGRLAIMPRPRSGDWLEDELKTWHTEGINIIVSLLTSPEVIELQLESESNICSTYKIEFITFPIPDRQVPSSQSETAALINHVDNALNQGKSVAIHCRAGIGRSGVIAACILLKQGFAVDTAFEVISKVRGIQVPDTEEQQHWVSSFNMKSL